MKPDKVLHEHNLKRTACREGIIEVISDAEQALSEYEIRRRLSGHFDRTTFYRSFKTLQENNILHKIVVDNQLVKYALDSSGFGTKNHSHFYCTSCKDIMCLGPVAVDLSVIPSGYKAKETEILIKGLCARCQ
jgi:Fur family ferric uptake transcriptional regulator